MCRASAVFAILLSLLTAAAIPAESHAQTRPPRNHPKDKLAFTLILANATGPAQPSADDTLTRLGQYLRADFDATGLFTADTCPAAADAYFYADTDASTIQAARTVSATLTGPGCPTLPVYIWHPRPSATPGPPAGSSPASSITADPNFHPVAGGAFPPPAAPPAALPASLRTDAPPRVASSNLLAHILDTLQQASVNRDLVPAPPPVGAKPGVPGAPTRSRVATDAQGQPETPPSRTPTVTAEVDAGPAKVKIDLHPSAHLDGAVGPAGTRLVYIAAHDTDLAGIAALLNLRRLPANIPPDAELVFELWQIHHKTPDDWPWTVRLRYRAATVAQLRSAAPLNLQAPPVELDVKPVGCKTSAGCNFANFLYGARAVVDPAYTHLQGPPVAPAP